MGWGGEALSLSPSPHTFVKLFRVILQHQYRQATRSSRDSGRCSANCKSDQRERSGPGRRTLPLPLPAPAGHLTSRLRCFIDVYVKYIVFTFLLLLSEDRIWSIKGGLAAGPPALDVRGGERGRERCL